MFFFPRKKGSARQSASAASPPTNPPKGVSQPTSAVPSTGAGASGAHPPSNLSVSLPSTGGADHPLADFATQQQLLDRTPRSAAPSTARAPAPASSGVLPAALNSFTYRGGASPDDGTAQSQGAGGGIIHPHEIVMDFGDLYTGEAALHPQRNVLVPHGAGTLQSARGRHCYVGGFKHQQREGWGKLVTETYVMWGAWKANRPNLSSAVRLDTQDGRKYSGYLEALTTATPTASEPVSRFTQFVHSTSYVRSGWGEQVETNGRRYFGQWAADLQTGFGCMLAPDGERYVGMWRKGQFHGSGVHTASNGLTYDGLWVDNAFRCTNGDVVFPRQVRLRGDWDDATRFKNATVILPDRRLEDRRFRITSLFDSLLLGATDAAKRKAAQAIAPLKQAIESTVETTADLDRIVVAHLRVNEGFINTLKIVRRCFYFLYGTCGASSARGAGQRENRLGWCYMRRSFGGCIHRASGIPITESTVHEALGDILSFVVSAHRWFMHHLGPTAKEIVDDLEGNSVFSRRILDAVLELVHAPLMNVYRQAYAQEQLELDTSLQRLGNISMDDVGVSFARVSAADKKSNLFVPYATAMNALQRLPRAATLSAKLNVLVRWSVDIDDETRMNQIKLQGDTEMTQVAAYLERRRQRMQEDPDAVPVPMAADMANASAESDETHAIAAAMNVEGGSLDDLFPIHQFVLMRAGVPDLAAHAHLIVHLADVDWLLDPTSREAFCVTNFKACVAMAAEMHPAIRDPQGVVAPTSSVLRKVEDVAESLSYGGNAEDAPLAASYLSTVVDWLSLTSDGDAPPNGEDGGQQQQPLEEADNKTEEGISVVLLPAPPAARRVTRAGADWYEDALALYDVEWDNNTGAGPADSSSSASAHEEGVEDDFDRATRASFLETVCRFAGAANLHCVLVDAADVFDPSNTDVSAMQTVKVSQWSPVADGSTTFGTANKASSSGGRRASWKPQRPVVAALANTALGRCARELQLVADALARIAGVSHSLG